MYPYQHHHTGLREVGAILAQQRLERLLERLVVGGREGRLRAWIAQLPHESLDARRRIPLLRHALGNRDQLGIGVSRRILARREFQPCRAHQPQHAQHPKDRD
jgi:hypothetical protein